jgi:hypothetical protein
MWSTNVYRDMGRALSLLQWIRDYAQPRTNVYWHYSYTNGVVSSYNSTTSFAVVNPYVQKYYYTSSGFTNVRVRGVTVLYDFVNSSAFTNEDILFQTVAYGASNGTSYAALTDPPSISGPIAPGSTGSAGWWPDDPDSFRSEIESLATEPDAGVHGWETIWSRSIPYDCYHVIFSALTKYLDQAPAR